MSRRSRNAAEAVWAVNCVLAVGALCVFWRTAVTRERMACPQNPAPPPWTAVAADEGFDAIWTAELCPAPPPPPPIPLDPQFEYEGLLGRRVALRADGQPLDTVRIGELLSIDVRGHPVRLIRADDEEALLEVEEDPPRDIHVPREAASSGK